ncbi:MAG TPA: tetratricopeptide repeat protein [Pseudonocardiaceae bacterium]|nr:tetratricopeptide repeat protein [Pseudonocardiaceae bacterium]
MAMVDAEQYDIEDTDGDGGQRRVSGPISNTVNVGVVSGQVVQAGVITGGVHQHLPASRAPMPAPRQLAAAPAGFVGRVDPLAALDLVLTDAPDGSSPRTGERTVGATVAISAIGAAGGFGKTWLALTWANRNLDRFPDGHLSVDLSGFGPGEPKHPGDVLADFLAALGVDRSTLPADLDARAALYRTHIAGKRMLILLDNAATADQVVPLLPGGTSCAVLVTSRHRLSALLTRHGALPVRVDVLTDTEARALLGSALGDAHVSGAEQVVTELIALCGGFPLALGLIAARVRTQPHLVDDIAAELRELGLGALDSEDPEASLPGVLSWSLCYLTEQQRTVFALLGIAPGPDVGLHSAINLAGLPVASTRAVLQELADASLITRNPGNRYAMHDLVRAYAITLAHQDLTVDTREAALRRVVDFYVHTAHSAERVLNYREPIRPDPPAPGCLPYPLPDQAAALVWLDTEHACLLAAQHAATTRGWHLAVWRLAQSLTAFHHRRGRLHDLLAVWQVGLAAAEHLPDPTNHTTLAHRVLGDAYAAVGQHEEAIGHLNQARALSERRHDSAGQAHAHFTIAIAWERRGDERLALEHATRAWDLFRTLDDPAWEAAALNMVGWYTARFGKYDQGREHCEAALTLHRRHGDPAGEARALDSLAYIDHHVGHHHQAIDRYEQALTLFRELGNTHEVATTLDSLGKPHADLGQHDQARAVWREAVELYRRQGRTGHAKRA